MMDSYRKRRRKSPRLKDYDYSLTNAYFITILCYKRQSLLSEKETIDIIASVWKSLPEKFENIEMDEFAIMPNHFHGIIIINDIGRIRRGGACPSLGAASGAPTGGSGTSDTSTDRNNIEEKPKKRHTLSDIVRVFKSLTAIAVN